MYTKTTITGWKSLYCSLHWVSHRRRVFQFILAKRYWYCFCITSQSAISSNNIFSKPWLQG